MTVEEYFKTHPEAKFSRIPIFKDNSENIVGMVLRSDLLLAQTNGENDHLLEVYQRPVRAIPDTFTLAKVLHKFLTDRDQMVMVVDEHGGLEGIITLEDILEKMIGTDIVDESDVVENMRQLAFEKKEHQY